MHWTDLHRVAFQNIPLDRRMLLGLKKVIKVRPPNGKFEKGVPTEVTFDIGFICFWFDTYVLKALGMSSIDEFVKVYQDHMSRTLPAKKDDTQDEGN